MPNLFGHACIQYFTSAYLVVVVEPIAIYILLFTAAYQLAMLYVLLCGPVGSIFTPRSLISFYMSTIDHLHLYSCILYDCY